MCDLQDLVFDTGLPVCTCVYMCVHVCVCVSVCVCVCGGDIPVVVLGDCVILGARESLCDSSFV